MGVWLNGAATLLSGVVFSYWLTHFSPWPRHGLASENEFLREELSRLQTTTCKAEAAQHSAVVTAILREQLGWFSLRP